MISLGCDVGAFFLDENSAILWVDRFACCETQVTESNIDLLKRGHVMMLLLLSIVPIKIALFRTGPLGMEGLVLVNIMVFCFHKLSYIGRMKIAVRVKEKGW